LLIFIFLFIEEEDVDTFLVVVHLYRLLGNLEEAIR
jgi:hypothetical protein